MVFEVSYISFIVYKFNVRDRENSTYNYQFPIFYLPCYCGFFAIPLLDLDQYIVVI